jgi:hypothetical protein
MSRTLESGFLGFDIANTTVTGWDDKYKDVKFSTTRLSVVAQAVADLLSPSLAPKTANRSLYIQDATVSLSDVLAALEKATGSTWTVNHADFDALVEESNAKLGAGDFSGIHYIIVGSILDVRTGSDFDKRGIVINELFGLPEADLQSVIDEIVARVKATK